MNSNQEDMLTSVGEEVIPPQQKDEQCDYFTQDPPKPTVLDLVLSLRAAEEEPREPTPRGVYFVWEFLYLPQFFRKPSTIKKKFLLQFLQVFDISREKKISVRGWKFRGWKGWKVSGWKGWKVGCWEDWKV